MDERSAGLLLHPTSLPGRFGIGDLGPGAERFLDWIAEGGQAVWQILPLGPPGFNNTPYTCFSAFAGNHLLVSPERLREDGLLDAEDLRKAPAFPAESVAFARVIEWKEELLRRAWDRFRSRASRALNEAFAAFVEEPDARVWLEDWVLYSALKELFSGRPWPEWPQGFRSRDPRVLSSARKDLSEEMGFHRFQQFLFNRQWGQVREAARRRGVRIMGDMPIYVALDSADVWANPHLFEVDGVGRPMKVAGVPPDYFSATGQLWGNPIYRWDRIAEDGYAWWIARVRENLKQVDLLRIDHFRGFAGYWEIPAGEATAVNGAWRPGPGRALFDAIRAALGDLPLVAEDLGHITDDVRDLVGDLGLPGMKVLQFAFTDPRSDHRPDRFGPCTVVYTGTHDNNTTRGWFAVAGDDERRRALEWLGTSGEEIHWDMIRAAYQSCAFLAIVPVQDVIGLGAEGRMNEPAKNNGNWAWRALADQLRPDLAARLRALAEGTGRLHAPRAVGVGDHAGG